MKRSLKKITVFLGSAILKLVAYGPRNRLLLRRGAPGSAMITHTRVTRMLYLWRSCLLSAGCFLIEWGTESFVQAGDNACQL